MPGLLITYCCVNWEFTDYSFGYFTMLFVIILDLFCIPYLVLLGVRVLLIIRSRRPLVLISSSGIG